MTAAAATVGIAALEVGVALEAVYATYLAGEAVYWVGVTGMAAMAGWQLDARIQAAQMQVFLAGERARMTAMAAAMIAYAMSEINSLDEYKKNRLKQIERMIDDWQQAPPDLPPPGKPPWMTDLQWLHKLMAEWTKLTGRKWPPDEPPTFPRLGPG